MAEAVQLMSISERMRTDVKTARVRWAGFRMLLESIGARLKNIHRVLSVSTGDGSWDLLVATTLSREQLGSNGIEIVATDIVDCAVRAEDIADIRQHCQWSFTRVEPDCPLPFPEQTFDLIIHQDVVEHTPKPYLFLAEQFRLLRPDGLLLFGTPNLLRPANLLKLLLGRLSFPVKLGANVEIGDYIHVQEFTEWQLRLMLEEIGFEIVEFQRCYWGLHFLGIAFASFPRHRLGRTMCHQIHVLARRPES